MKINSVEDFAKLKESIKILPKIIRVGMGTCGIASGADKLYSLIEAKIDNETSLERVGCIGECFNEPIVDVCINGKTKRFNKVTAEMIDEIINLQTINEPYPERKLEKKIALKNCGVINPEKITDYIFLDDGYLALIKSIFKLNPEGIINIIKDSGLRGRGGAGFPTGVKWESTKNAEGDKKYVVCNADEGDPGAFMDRAVLEGNPHRILEAMIICGYTIGANEGIIYVRSEYPLAVKRLEKAIKEAYEYGFLGKDILGSKFDFDIKLSLGAGAFVCGEETSLLNSIEGLRGEPKAKPPFPATKGLFELPTNINNVETFANIPKIILKESAWFKGIGTETSKGTKVFALAGKVNNTGLVEVPMGTSLKDIIYDLGGGIPNNKKFKAAQTGGPSGGCIPEKFINIKIDYESLKEIGSMMGSGGLIVMDQDDCMVDIAKYYLTFTTAESCGKCTPCRIGTTRLLEILEKITNGNGTEEDLEKLDELSNIIRDTSLCGLGQSAPNPILSTMKYFEKEYKEHIEEKKCSSHKCLNLLSYQINDTKCIGCGLCAMKCPTNCIGGIRKSPYVINQEECIKCNTCYKVCPVKAVERN